MGKSTIAIFYVVVMAATVVIIDILFFRHRPWARLMVNICIVAVYAVFYFTVLKNR